MRKHNMQGPNMAASQPPSKFFGVIDFTWKTVMILSITGLLGNEELPPKIVERLTTGPDVTSPYFIFLHVVEFGLFLMLDLMLIFCSVVLLVTVCCPTRNRATGNVEVHVPPVQLAAIGFGLYFISSLCVNIFGLFIRFFNFEQPTEGVARFTVHLLFTIIIAASFFYSLVIINSYYRSLVTQKENELTLTSMMRDIKKTLGLSHKTTPVLKNKQKR